MKIQSRDNNGLPQCGSVTSKGPTCIESNTMAFEGGKRALLWGRPARRGGKSQSFLFHPGLGQNLRVRGIHTSSWLASFYPVHRWYSCWKPHGPYWWASCFVKRWVAMLLFFELSRQEILRSRIILEIWFPILHMCIAVCKITQDLINQSTYLRKLCAVSVWLQSTVCVRRQNQFKQVSVLCAVAVVVGEWETALLWINLKSVISTHMVIILEFVFCLFVFHFTS